MKSSEDYKSNHVFISYSSENKNVADAIVADFEQHGIKCWYAPRDVLPGKSFMGAIVEAIENSLCVVLIYTPESNNSIHVLREMSCAFEESKTIIPFRQTEEDMNKDIKYILSGCHWMDALTPPLGKNICELRKKVLMIIPESAVVKKPDSGYESKITPAKDRVEEKNMDNTGDAEAQYNLGWCYYKGQGVKQDYQKAVEWYIKAADQGHAKAQCNLGKCYKNGRGVERDYKKAVEWYTKAADQGDTEAQFNLGWCYNKGQGVKQDHQKEVEWYTKAADQGHAEAQFNLGWCYNKGQGVKQDHQKAVEWYTKAADQGHAKAQYYLGWCYYKGQGVKQDYQKAVEWYTKAADQGDTEAQEKLSKL